MTVTAKIHQPYELVGRRIGHVTVLQCLGELEMDDSKLNGRYEDKYGTVCWYKDGQLHREDGPAIIEADGSKHWYLNGQRHRKDGPAVQGLKGYKEWYLNDKIHREDGPAVEYTNGGKEWFINGVQYTEEEFNRWLEKYQLNKKLQHTLEVKPLGNKLKI